MENNMIKTNTASNETMAADNRSAVKIWQEFTTNLNSAKMIDGNDVNSQYYDSLRFLMTALNKYIEYCFESVSHKKLSPENIILYSHAAFNKAFDGFFMLNEPIVNKIFAFNQQVNDRLDDPVEIKYDLIIIDPYIYDIYLKMYDMLAESMDTKPSMLRNIAYCTARYEAFVKSYYGDSSLYKELRIYDDFENRVFDRCPEVNVVDKLMAYLMSTSAKSKVEKYCSDFYIEARIAMQEILEHTIFKDEKYSHVASYIKGIVDNSIDFSVTQCRQIIDEIYKIVEEKMCCTSAGEIKDICCAFE